MSKKKDLVSDDWKKYYDDLAAKAAKESGVHLILGSIHGSLDINAGGYDTDAVTLAHIRYLLQAYSTALKSTIPQ